MKLAETYLCIPGVPIPKKRPRFRNFGKFVSTYDPQEKEKKRFASLLFDASKNMEFSAHLNADFRGYIFLRLSYHLSVANSLPNAQKNENKWQIQHAIKPDIDNLAKFTLDCANGILYRDDSQISKLILEKKYSDNPRTIIQMQIFSDLSLQDKHKKIITLFSPTELKKMIDDLRCLSSIEIDDDDNDYKNLDKIAILLSEFMKCFGEKLAKIRKMQ